MWINRVLYGIVIYPMLTNSTQWLDLPAQNEPGLQSPDSTTTVKKEIHSSRKIADLLSISQPDGNLRPTQNQSILPIKKGLDG